MALPVSTAGPPPGGPAQGAVWLPWESVTRWLRGQLREVQGVDGPVRLGPYWKPGQHWALCGPTGEGKSTLAVALLELRRYVLALDPKGEDETLARSGYTRVTGLPPREKFPKDIQERLDDGRPVKLIVGGSSTSDAEDVKLQQLMADALTYARHAGGWTVYVDEFELLSSQRMFALGPPVERMLITARRARSSIITSFQAAAWVSKHATRQAAYVVLFPTRDRDMIEAVAKAMGRDWRTIAAALDELPPFHVLIICKDHRAPLVITKAPKLGK